MNIETVPFERVAGRVERLWSPIEGNPHMVLLAATRGGKSHLIRHGILPLAPDDRAVVIDVKPGGDLTWDGWGNDVTAIEPGFGRGPDGTMRYRLQVLPGSEGAVQVRRVLDQLAAEGEAILIIDDARKVTDSHDPGLKCGNVVDHLLLEGAGFGLTAILGANSTAWATSAVKDQCEYIWLGHTRTDVQRDEFAKLAGLPKDDRPVLNTIAQRHWLYTDFAGDDLVMGLTSLPGTAA
jgi:hypothetical protein